DFAELGGTSQLINGITVSYTWNATTNTLTANDGEQDVFTVGVTPSTGAYTVTLLNSLDHHTAGSADNSRAAALLNLSSRITDGDGDSTHGTLSFTIDDDTPVALSNTAFTLDEDGNTGGTGDFTPADNLHKSASGTLGFNFGADSEGSIDFAELGGTSQLINGITVSYTWNATTNTLTANDGEQNVFTVGVTPSTGAYTVTLLNSLDHHTAGSADNSETDALFNLSYRITDGDGDSTHGTLSFTIDDETPVALSKTGFTLDEDGKTGGTGDFTPADNLPKSASGTLGFNFGADSEGSIDFAELGGTSQLINGITVSYTWNATTNTLTANDGEQNVFTVGVTPSTGAYTVTLLNSLDHHTAGSADNSETDALFNLSYRITDGDGDSTHGTLSFTIDDDTPVALSNTAFTLDEDGNTGGTGDFTPADNLPKSASGTLGFNFGADSEGSIDFAELGGTSQLINGITVSYTWNATTNTLTANDGEQNVFTVGVTPSTGAYTVTLLNSLDHHTAGSADNSETDALFNLSYRITDGDGDSTHGTLSFTIDDETPVALSKTGFTLDEDGKTGGTGDFTPADNLPKSASGTLGFNFGADSEGSIDFAELGGTSQLINGITVSYTWNATTNTLTANDGEQNVFTVGVTPSTGAYTVTLLNSLDHHTAGSADNSETDALFNLSYRITDGDGDSTHGTLSFTIDDETPVALSKTGFTLDEDGKTGGTGDFTPADNLPKSASGTLGFNFGADSEGSIDFAELGGTSQLINGITVSYTWNATTNTLTANDGEQNVFTVGVTPSTGAYTVTLLNSLDHHTAGSADNSETDALFNLSYRITDGDGDSTHGTLSFTIDDDTPVALSNTAFTLDEDGNTGGTGDFTPADNLPKSASGTLGFNFGADSEGSIDFAELGGTSQLINGITVSYTWNATTNTLTANDGEQNVFTVGVTPSTGAYTVTLLNSLDHHTAGSADNSETDALFNLSYRITDGDGDSTHGTLSFTIDDETPVALSKTGFTLDEDGKTGGTGDFTPADNLPKSASGTLGFNFGADSEGSIDFAELGGTSQLINGITVSYTWNATTNTLTANDGEQNVFTVGVTPSTGAYTVTLLNSLDHHTAGSADNSETDALFNLSYRITDGDGDSTHGTLSFTIDDDTPVALSNTAFTLDEDGNTGGTGDFTPADNLHKSASGTLGFNFGADSEGSIDFAELGGTSQLINGITVSYTWNATTNTLTANDGEQNVFTVGVTPSTGAYTVTLLNSLDHHTAGSADNSETDALFNLSYRITDGDGDSTHGTL